MELIYFQHFSFLNTGVYQKETYDWNLATMFLENDKNAQVIETNYSHIEGTLSSWRIIITILKYGLNLF